MANIEQMIINSSAEYNPHQLKEIELKEVHSPFLYNVLIKCTGMKYIGSIWGQSKVIKEFEDLSGYKLITPIYQYVGTDYNNGSALFIFNEKQYLRVFDRTFSQS